MVSLLTILQPALKKDIETLHQWILEEDPTVYMSVQKGFNAITYGIGPSMNKEGYAYIIVYKKKANLGFDQGVMLAQYTPLFLQGTGQGHRHLVIDSLLLLKKQAVKDLLNLAKQQRIKSQ